MGGGLSKGSRPCCLAESTKLVMFTMNSERGSKRPKKLVRKSPGLCLMVVGLREVIETSKKAAHRSKIFKYARKGNCGKFSHAIIAAFTARDCSLPAAPVLVNGKSVRHRHRDGGRHDLNCLHWRSYRVAADIHWYTCTPATTRWWMRLTPPIALALVSKSREAAGKQRQKSGVGRFRYWHAVNELR